MARTQNVKQINFIPADDVAEQLAECENKTKIINEALRMYFKEGLQLDLVQRVQLLEDFRHRFMQYYARTDNKPHSEFCDCQTCKNTRTSFAAMQTVPLDPEAQSYEMVRSVIERGTEQACRMNATVVFRDRNGYEFRLNANSDVSEEYARYLKDVESH